jgi:hypothetical protein
MIIKTKSGCYFLIKLVFSILVISIFTACQKIINVDLNEVSPMIVIEGFIIDRPGPYMVTISKSGSYFDQPDLPAVSGAKVIIADNYGSVDTLKETKPGIYLTSSLRGSPGRVYTLKVLSENKEYTASSTMHSRVNIDSVNLTKSRFQHFGFVEDGRNDIDIDLNCFFRDPLEKNFYRFKVFRNDTLRTEDYHLYDDQYSNGQEISLRVAHVNAKDTFRIELYSLDKTTFGYYRTLQELMYSNPVFGSTPANPDNNFNNGALGYFGASAVSYKTVIITDSLLKRVR